MEKKTLTDVLIDLGLLDDDPPAAALDGGNKPPSVLDGKSQNEEKSRE